ncbi:Serine/Threonine kinase domain protein (macronuclear) [Tetrahymena thermophila SB210]|uniref:Serine/Threonine kinase domain protein n=1 Tax=Tetrahymena thermophila (strain SB210) TaxID=312017 RepID=I7MIC0_TETTS|nr:Serine/Threonine kinase domain protein [Tetrahymena thermophila SB210]EAR92864.1 Serine/Threonine kinase domain protein [Tetrahymena thermophila SB210]|eukprot:XP_001013109.1 Serine/Threonine kinase domain protein [Tetrahymena thermophila SB210]
MIDVNILQSITTGSLETQIYEVYLSKSSQSTNQNNKFFLNAQEGYYIGKSISKSCNFSLKLLDNEINILKELNNDYIIKAIGLHETQQSKMLVLESYYCDLSDFIAQNSTPLPTFSLFDLRYMISDIAKGLEYLHSKQISHNDIKPSNILLDESCNVVLSDFGTASMSEGQSSEHLNYITSIMNKTYLAPEINGLAEQKIIHFNPFKSDIFSFGLTIFSLMFGGQLPYESDQYRNYDKKFKLLHSNPDLFFARQEYEQYIQYWKQQKEFKYSLFVEFIQSILNPDPLKRMTASQVLDHQWLENF